MIKRKYFFSGFIDRHNSKDDFFDGIVAVTSFLPQPELAYKKIREGAAKESNAYTDGQKIRIKTLVKL